MSRQLKKRDSDDDETANFKGEWLLLSGVKSLLRCDEAEAVKGIADYVASQRAGLRLLARLIEVTRNTPIPSFIALIGAIKSFLEVGADARRGGAVWIARLENEKRAVENLPTLAPELAWTELKFDFRFDLSSLASLFLHLQTWRRALKIARRLRRRHEFYKALRVAELICFYARFLEIFRRGKFQLAVASNHSNPHGVAFNLAARRLRVPVVLVTHGMPVRPVARLEYALALVHCEFARRIYAEAGCTIQRAFLHGRRQDYKPMPERLPQSLSIGIFLSKDVNETRLRAVVERLLAQARASRITLRPHPANLWEGLDRWLAARRDSRLQRSFNHTIARDVEDSDIILAGNSSALIEAVTAG